MVGMSVQYKDYYEILGVSRSATEKEIKSAFRKLARQYHPDVHPDQGEKFKDLNEAYEVLGDPQKRKMYDQLGPDWKQGQGFPGGGAGFGGFPGGGYSGSYEDLGFGGSGFSDFFEALFGQMGGGVRFQNAAGFAGAGGAYDDYFGGAQQQQRHQRVAENLDLEQPIYLTLEEINNGVQKSVRLSHSGKNMTVSVPRGVKRNAKIRLAGQGKTGRSGQRGDLFLTVHYDAHPVFEIDPHNDSNLLCDVKVPIPDLVLGGEMTVPTLQGNVTLTIPAGTATGKLLRVKGRGLATKSGHGDLMVRIQAAIPKHPSAAEQALYEELRRQP